MSSDFLPTPDLDEAFDAMKNFVNATSAFYKIGVAAKHDQYLEQLRQACGLFLNAITKPNQPPPDLGQVITYFSKPEQRAKLHSLGENEIQHMMHALLDIHSSMTSAVGGSVVHTVSVLNSHHAHAPSDHSIATSHNVPMFSDSPAYHPWNSV
jgi:hypothetical protein